MHQEITARRVAHRIQQLSDPILLDGAGEGVVYGIAGLGEGGLAGKVGGQGMVGQGDAGGGVHGIQIEGLDQMVGQDMLQKEMEAMAVVLMAEVAEFVQKDVVLQHARKAHYAEIQIDVSLGGAASPVCCVMFYGDTVICKAITRSQFCKTPRKFGLCLSAQ